MNTDRLDEIIIEDREAPDGEPIHIWVESYAMATLLEMLSTTDLRADLIEKE